jgi:hypothetical protein
MRRALVVKALQASSAPAPAPTRASDTAAWPKLDELGTADGVAEAARCVGHVCVARTVRAGPPRHVQKGVLA